MDLVLLAKRVRRRLLRAVRPRRADPAPGSRPVRDNSETPTEHASREHNSADTPAGDASDEQPQAVVYLRTVRWLGAVLELTGWAYHDGQQDHPRPRVIAARPTGGEAEFEVRTGASEIVNVHSADADVDHSDAAFTARLDTAALLADQPAGVFEATWRVTVGLDEQTPQGHPFNQRFGTGSAGQLTAQDVDGCLLRPLWSKEAGLTLVVARRAVTAIEVQVAGSTATLDVLTAGKFRAQRAELRTDDGEERPVQLTELDARHYRIMIDVRPLSAAGDRGVRADPGTVRQWYLTLVERAGRARRVHWSGDNRGKDWPFPDAPACSLRNAPGGAIRVDIAISRIWVDEASVQAGSQPALTVKGRWYGAAAPSVLTLRANRIVVPAAELDVDSERFRAVFRLLHREPWAAAERPLRSGTYQLTMPDGTIAEASPALAEQLPDWLTVETHQLRIEVDGRGRFLFTVRPPRPLTETGAFQQQVLQEIQRAGDVAPEDAVYFESYSGTNSYDQPRAIHDELVRRRPDLVRYWGVADGSLEVPPGCVPLLVRTREWWQALAGVRYVVTNAWLPKTFERRPHQIVQQAWHGTPFKAMGLDRIGPATLHGDKVKLLADVGMWSQLIAQNRYSADIFRAAYRFAGELLEIGHPRNDELVRGLDPADQAERRARLGLADDQLVVLYLPTWREVDKLVYRGLDFDHLLGGLGPDARLLVRGHAFTIDHDRAIEHRAVVDVTLYPNLNDLYAIADVLITDYSSAMFDFSVTGKPMIFFAPDLDRYATELRGAYFSLADSAPGPVVATTEAVVEALRDLRELERCYAERYRTWRERFNYLDDGHAAARAVDALLADQRVPRPGPDVL